MAPRRRAPEDWAAEQRRLAEKRVAHDDIDWAVHGQFVTGLDRVAGVDVSFFPDSSYAVAAVVVLSFKDLKVVYKRCAAIRLAVPYIPGYLAFREVPALATLLDQVPDNLRPQVVLMDGNGAFHPRRCGAATHLGIITDMPTIGVAKTVQHVDDVNRRVAEKIAKTLTGASAWAPLEGEGKCAGEEETEPLAMLLRPCSAPAFIVVSSGHRVSLTTAVRLISVLCRNGSKIPEPIQQADAVSRAAVKQWFNGKVLHDLQVKEGLLPAIPNLKRVAEDEAEQPSKRAKGKWKDKESEEVPEKKAGKLWRVKVSQPVQPEVQPPTPAAEESAKPTKAEKQGAKAGKLGKKVWKVKAAEPELEANSADVEAAEPEPEANPADLSAPPLLIIDLEDTESEKEAAGFFGRLLSQLGGCCFCRG